MSNTHLWIELCGLYIYVNLSSIAPSSPLNLSVSSGYTNLFPMWSPPVPTNGIITAYTVYCNTSVSQAYPEQVIGPNVPTVRSVVNGTTTAVIFNIGLNPYTQYDCYVTANTSVGEGTPSQIVTATTDQYSEQNPIISIFIISIVKRILYILLCMYKI